MTKTPRRRTLNPDWMPKPDILEDYADRLAKIQVLAEEIVEWNHDRRLDLLLGRDESKKLAGKIMKICKGDGR